MAVRYPARMDRRGWTLALCALAVAAALFWRGLADDGGAQDESPVAVPATKVEAAETVASVPDGNAHGTSAKPDLLAVLADTTQAPPPLPPPTFTEPLPPWDAKLVDVLPALKARADAGDHVAACHIGLALSACALYRSHRPSPAEVRQADPDDAEAVDRIARLSGDVTRPAREQTCDGLNDDALDQSFGYLQQSADAGNATAMLAYAEGMPMQNFRVALRHPEWLEAHRERTPRYVAELVRRGDRFAAFLLSMGNDGMQMSFMGRALQMDEMTAATFWYLGREILGQPKSPWHGATPGIEREARERARSLHDRYFDSRPFRSGEFNHRADFLKVESCATLP